MSNFVVYAPLQHFESNTSQAELAPGLWLKQLHEKPDLQGLEQTLSDDEQADLFSTNHWLTFRWDKGTEPCPAETVNIALLSLRLVKPTRTHVAFRFELGRDNLAGNKSRHRLFDRFAWVEEAVEDLINDSDLEKAATLFGPLRDLCCRRGRLNNAIFLTLAGCWSHNWQVALICHAAAAEAILTYSTKPGVTRRLATTYACVVKEKRSGRDMAFQEFVNLYSVRSDIMHGRSHNVSDVERLSTLARFNKMLRQLWSIVLLSPPLIDALEGTDSQREDYFQRLRDSYTPPSKTGE